jgi:hypothetical protein
VKGLILAALGLCAAGGAWVGHALTLSKAAEEDARQRWPEDAPVALDEARPTMIIFLHPGSPVSPEVLAEVRRLQGRMRGRLAVSVRVYRRDGPIAGWDRLPVWQEARSLCSDVAADPGGDQARLFGAAPSGTAVLFAPSGRLMFRGEIAPSRKASTKFSVLSAILRPWIAVEPSPVLGRLEAV